MRILVLQLARFGDIYLTWPSLRALQRQGHEVHLLVRERFQAATLGLSGVTVHVLPTASILEPILSTGSDSEALARLAAVTEELSALQFAKIINLSFSPASSYLTQLLSQPSTEVRGYTRHEDGYLSIPDDSSAYFYAQIGIDKPNRYHLNDVFAAVSDVTLLPQDRAPETHAKLDRLVVHLGASQIQKAYSPELWVQVLKNLAGRFLGEIILIGSDDERVLSETVMKQANMLELRNRTGETSLPELFELIASARVLIGADSAPIHIAGLVGTPVLNLSSRTVNFWETGPSSPGSRVLFAEDLQLLEPAVVASEALALLNHRGPLGPCYVRTENGYDGYLQNPKDEFAWQLLQALYTGSAYPKAPDLACRLAFQRLFELAELALIQLARWKVDDHESSTASQILGSIDQLLQELPRLNRDVAPVVQWFQTQRLRLPPASGDETLRATRKLFEELLWIAAVYHQPQTDPRAAIALCSQLTPALREYEFSAVEAEFQRLIASLQDLARHSTNVGERPWSSVLKGMNEALRRRDYIELADQLEYELKPQLEFVSNFSSRP